MKTWDGRAVWKIVALLFYLFAVMGRAQMPPIPSDPFRQLTTWSFEDTSWYSDLGYAPLSFINLNNPGSFDGNALQVDSTNNAWLQYNIFESDGTTNLTLNQGTVELWVLPDWNSATNGGTGPGDWGRLIDVGAFNTNSPSGWWSLYFSPDGNNIYFSSETNGVFTNYLNCPISWDTNTWHFLALTYNRFHSALYVDGQLATNGSGALYLPTAEVVSNGFFVGSDDTGWAQSRALIDDMATYNYALSAYQVTNDYAGWLQILNGGGFHADDGPSLPGGFGGGTNGGSGSFGYTPPDYGSNLWIAAFGIVSNAVPLLLSNTEPDVLYEIQGRTNLVLGDWFSEGFVNGSEVTNCTPASVFAGKQGNLFLRVRSWADDTGTGIPDWWWLQYFGQITNVDAYAADPAGDGYTDFQKFQLGLNPLNYYNSNPPDGFFGCLDATGTNVVLEWSNAPGPVAGYIVQRGIYNITNNGYDYTQFAVSSNAVFFKDVGAISDDNSWSDIYNLQAVYPDGSLTATDTWYASDAQFGLSGPPDGAPLPGDVYAYAHLTDTNVFLSWTPAAGLVTNYIILRGVYDTNIYDYDYSQIATVNSNTTYLSDVGVIHSVNDWSDVYQVEAVYPGGGLSQPVTTGISTNSTPPTDFTATVDSTGTNVMLTWTPPPGSAVTNYVIQRAIYNTNTSSYGSFSTIAQVSGSTISFTDAGAITDNNRLNNGYQIAGINTNGDRSVYADSYLPGPPSLPPAFDNNNPISVCLVRNEAGCWQLMFSYIPPNVKSLNIYFDDYIYDIANDFGTLVQTNILAASLTNGVFVIPNYLATNDFDLLFNERGNIIFAQPVMSNGIAGSEAFAGFMYNDAPYFVDGSQHLKQNLLFKLRAATINHPATVSDTTYDESGVVLYDTYSIPVDPEYVESSFFHLSYQQKLVGNLYPSFMKMSDLWPFDENYQWHQRLYDPDHPEVPKTFSWTNNFASIPAPTVLGIGEPYWIHQDPTNIADCGGLLAAGGASISLEGGIKNLYGLSLSSGVGIRNSTNEINETNGLPLSVPWIQFDLSPGGSYTFQYGESMANYYSEFESPTLALTNYFFSSVNTPGTSLSGFNVDNQTQIYPLPSAAGFASTNQTGLMIGSVGVPMVIGGWAKYSISGSSPSKYAYLGQYFQTNAFVVTNGVLTTNMTGIVSPYGNFFPTEPGTVAMITMPDIDTGAKGTCAVQVISMNVDANHDGTMDFHYNSPDFVSSSKPFRFWINDNQDAGDTDGNGIPGMRAWPDAHPDVLANSITGRRDLLDFFPVYLNIQSVLQGATNITVLLKQADTALYFLETDLSPTNYMNFLRDTNFWPSLETTSTLPIGPSGRGLTDTFRNSIRDQGEGIILVEACKATTAPLVLEIYQGTNLLAQTSLYLSISGVEQMFRHKNLLLNTPPAMPDRLTDADVPNEPDTIDKNFVFLHGYNVLPNEARGVAADMFKRMYWSGSHAKFYAVTWEGADTKGSFPFGDRLTPNYHTNVVSAFNTAPLLANFIASLTNSGPVVASAHSLGNMVTLSAISDWNAPISQYFMLDAAVPIEAIDPSATTNMMIYSTWAGYTNRLYSSAWNNLFPTNDARSTLSWNNRLGNLQNVDVYNFYSSGEEVLRTSTNDPPPSVLNKLYTQITDFWPFGIPFGTYTWYWQEKGKGTCTQDWFLGSSHGGWQFNNLSYSTNISTMGILYQLRSPGSAAQLTDSQLRTNSFFDFNSDNNSYDIAHPDAALLGSGGSTYAATYRNRILADAIPAMSLVAGANPVPSFDITHNLNMNTPAFQNGWSLGRTAQEASMWHHSDFVQMAYTFTYKLFNQFVTIGNLK